MVKSEFVLLIDERDEKIESHFGDDMSEMLNYPDEREWYTENIFPLDVKIVNLGNNILQKKLGKSDEEIKTIRDVYNNQTLIDYYNERKEEIGHPSASSTNTTVYR